MEFTIIHINSHSRSSSTIFVKHRQVMDSMHTLFMAITGGLNWFDAYAPLRQVSLVALWLMLLGFRGGYAAAMGKKHRFGGSKMEQTQQSRLVSQKISGKYVELPESWMIFVPRALGNRGKLLGRRMQMTSDRLSCRMVVPPARNLFIVIGFFTILNVAWKDSGAES